MNTTPPPASDEKPESGGAPPEEAARDAWAVRVARVSGIPIRLHFTFLLIVIWFAISGIGVSRSWMVLSMLGLFFCIVLHELGHSLVAQHYGYRVRDITLYPIGGVAAIEGSPRPRHELYIALAGPAVNVVIALLLAGIIGAMGSMPQLLGPMQQRAELFQRSPLAFLLIANITVALFNMIPAFPMDGGRVLRAILGIFLGKSRATGIAAGVGQVLSVVMALFGLGVIGGSPNYGLVIIALFVYFGAGQERAVEQSRVAVDDAPVEAAMVREFQTLVVGDTLQRASEMLLATSQQDFPVLLGEAVAGVLSRGQLLRGLAQHGPGAFVAGEMTRDVVFALPNDPLEEFMLRPDGVQRAPVLVREAGTDRLIGMLTMDNLMEFLTLRQIAQEQDEENADRSRR